MIVIPMAGMSSRFFNAGYTKPKYMLEAHGKTLFEHSVSSFKAYFESLSFLFVVKDVFNTPAFVRQQAEKMGIKCFHIISLNDDTRGQAETVALGLEKLDRSGVHYDGAITVFNIDTFRPGFLFPKVSEGGDGYLEVFHGGGSNWSFAKPVAEDSTLVRKTAEKNPISNLCSTGLYHFSRKQDYLDAYYEYISKPEEEWEKGELYIAPLYNNLIMNGLDIHYHIIDREDVIFCGVPDEYIDFKNNSLIK
ncbi:glycosyltransferase family 2 protein [Vibrio breoganii]